MSSVSKNLTHKIKSDSNTILGYAIGIVGLSLVLVMRLLPSIKYPVQTYGYDFGFYLYALAHADRLNSTTLLGSALGGYSNPLFFLAYHLHLPAEPTLIGLNLILSVACAAMIYWVSDSKLTGFYALLLLAFSIIQGSVYTMFLLKSSLGLIVLLGAYKAIEQKKHYWLIITTLLLFWLHRTTAIIYSLALTFYGIYKLARKTHNSLLTLGAVIVIVVLGYLVLATTSNTLFNNQSSFVRNGIFLEGTSIIKYIWPYLIGGVIGVYFALKENKYTFFICVCLVSVLWILFQLPFYRRVYIYLDISLIILAAYGFSKISTKSVAAAIVVFILIFVGWQSISFNLGQQPLITKSDIKEIETVSKNYAGYFVLATDARDAPWLLGYSKEVRLAAPGLFEDTSSFQEWRDFWEGREQIKFLSKYPKPLLVFSRLSLQSEMGKCLRKISIHFYEFKCDSGQSQSSLKLTEKIIRY